MNRGRRHFLATAGLLALAGCSSAEPTPTDSKTPDTGGGPSVTVTGTAYTHIRPSGNRVVDGEGSLPDAEPIDVPVEGTPAWTVALPADRGSLWVVVTRQGRTSAHHVADGTVEPASVTPGSLPAGTPPVLTARERTATLLDPPGDASELTHPLPVGDDLLYVAENGDLALAGSEDRLGIDALPDARVVRVPGDDRVVVLGGATDRYGHGALGDGTEAGEVLVVSVADGIAIETRIDVSPAVVEGVAPLLADLTGDGEPEIVVTATDAERGARVVAYSLGGERVATGPAIGSGYRWRHQLCVAPFPPDGRPELAAVKTPHIGGTAEFYRRKGDRLEIVASADGHSSHAYQSRNLDGGLAGDLDGDGRVELLVPTDDRRELVGLRRTGDGVERAWGLPLGGQVTTNVHAVAYDGGVAVGAGTASGLRVWR